MDFRLPRWLEADPSRAPAAQSSPNVLQALAFCSTGPDLRQRSTKPMRSKRRMRMTEAWSTRPHPARATIIACLHPLRPSFSPSPAVLSPRSLSRLTRSPYRRLRSRFETSFLRLRPKTSHQRRSLPRRLQRTSLRHRRSDHLPSSHPRPTSPLSGRWCTRRFRRRRRTLLVSSRCTPSFQHQHKPLTSRA